jgi:hypothetical protein
LDGVRWAVDPSLSADGYDTEERQAIQDADARPPYLPDDDPKIVVMVDRVIACAPMSPMEIQP